MSPGRVCIPLHTVGRIAYAPRSLPKPTGHVERAMLVPKREERASRVQIIMNYLSIGSGYLQRAEGMSREEMTDDESAAASQGIRNTGMSRLESDDYVSLLLIVAFIMFFLLVLVVFAELFSRGNPTPYNPRVRR